MTRTVGFHDDIVAQAEAVAPSFTFPQFAQTAVRDKIKRELIERERLLRHGPTITE